MLAIWELTPPRKLVIVFLNAGQVQPGRELMVIWYCVTSGGVIECSAMIQPWPGWGIIMTERSWALRESEEPMHSRYWGFGRVAVRLTSFPSLFPGYMSASVGTGMESRFAGDGAVEKNLLGETGTFYGSWNPAASRARILHCLRLVPSFISQTSGMLGLSCCVEYWTTHLRRVLNNIWISSEQKKNFVVFLTFLLVLCHW